MSRTTTLIVICVLMTIGFAFAKVQSSQSGKQMAFQEESLASRLNITGKLHSNLNLKVRPTNEDKYEAGKDLSLIAELSSDTRLQNINLSWSLPADITLVSGELNTTILELKPNQTQKIEITIRGSSIENSRLFLQASLNENGIHFKEIAQYNTVFQKQMEEEKAALAERTKESVTSQLKIYK